MGGTATLRIEDLPAHGPPGRLVALECAHGTTRLASVGAASGTPCSDELTVRLALLKHYRGQRCGCIRHLWRQHFGSEPGEVVLARGRVG